MGIGSITSLGAGLGSGIYKYKHGKDQQKQADKINPIRPTYTIPNSINTQVDLYRGLANQSQLPQQRLMEDQLNATTSTGISSLERAGGSAQDIIAGASNLSGNQTRSLNALTIAGAEQQRQAQMLYGNSLGTMAQYQDQEFNLNQMIPYMNDVERKEALIAAAHLNKSAAFSDVGNAGAEYERSEQAEKDSATSAFSSLAGIASDQRLKKNIKKLGQSPSGLGIYSFEYIKSENTPGTYTGSMADEVEQQNKDAVLTRSDGFKMVRYSMIDVEFKRVESSKYKV